MSLGTRKLTRPTSRIGLTTTTAPPRRLSSTIVRRSRGWFEAGLAPIRKRRSHASSPSRSTVPALEPSVSLRATAEALWQKKEQLLTLLVPWRRARSW